MSVQSEINRLKQAVSDAFTAIGNKGGTVPTSKVSGNLATAINSIPAGAKVQTQTGTIDAKDDNPCATVNCGFKPDLVILFMNDGNEYGDYYHQAYAFTALNTDTALQLAETTEYFIYTEARRTETGFSIQYIKAFSFDWEELGSILQSFRYTAVKYT